MPVDIEETFNNILRDIHMKLNTGKCSLGYEEGKFHGHMVGKQSAKANSSNIKAVVDMKFPTTREEVESLYVKLAALLRFLSKSAKKSLPFFKALKGCTDKRKFLWSEEAENLSKT